MVRATRGSNRNRKNNRQSDSIYHGSFAGDRRSFINGTAAPDDFWSEISQEETHRSNADLRMVARRSTNKQISSLESQLTEMRASNNEVYNEIVGNVDLEEIRRIAIEEFGMKYANQDQIVVYSETKGDRVHQIADLDN